MHKGFFIVNYNTLLHVSTLLGHLQGELFGMFTLRLHYTVERECAVDCVLRCFWRREFFVVFVVLVFNVFCTITQLFTGS
jgi:hypothetical protein